MTRSALGSARDVGDLRLDLAFLLGGSSPVGRSISTAPSAKIAALTACTGRRGQQRDRAAGADGDAGLDDEARRRTDHHRRGAEPGREDQRRDEGLVGQLGRDDQREDGQP